jgi:peptide/nickel transport system ATP-binding protein
MVFQDPMTSLNPVRRIAGQLVEGMVVHGRYDKKAARARAVDLLRRMGVSAPERAIDSYPHEFSGGMRQRVMLAMGFANGPSLLIADEPTTALDVTIQAQILDLLRDLSAEFGTAVLLISHDLGVIANVCQRIIVMYAGEVVEEGPAEQLLADPRHPYTWALINAVPRVDRYVAGDKHLMALEGQPPDPLQLPTGCRFAARCPFRMERCVDHPPLREIEPGRKARCFLTQISGEKLPLRGQVIAPGRPSRCRRRATMARRSSPRRRDRSSSCRGSPSTSSCVAAACSARHARCMPSTASISSCSAARRSAWSASPAAASRRSRAS